MAKTTRTEDNESEKLSRRGVIKAGTTFTAVALLPTAISCSVFEAQDAGNETSEGNANSQNPTDTGVATDQLAFAEDSRAGRALEIRNTAATTQSQLAEPVHQKNSDETERADYSGNFSKTLPHNELAEVLPAAYEALVAAIDSGQMEQFNQIPSGGVRKLVNPRGANCFAMSGADPHKLTMPAVHGLASARQASEAAEVYWMALARDTPFSLWSEDAVTNAAILDLNTFTDFTAPKENAAITANTLFRGLTPGDLAGPYISQFLLQNIPYGSSAIGQTPSAPTPVDFMIDTAEFVNIQNGAQPTAQTAFGSPRHLTTPRDLAEYVHSDYSYQAYLNAALILLGWENSLKPNPYSNATREDPFISFGGPDVLDLVARAAVVGLRPAWFHKWNVHRKLRPEAFGARLHNEVTNLKSYGLNAEILNSTAVADTFSKNGTYLISQAYPEGSPTHPSYPAGHASVAGACVTVLKAYFDENFAIPQSVTVDGNGTYTTYEASQLTAGGELNKLASNIALGRNFAGVHWRADGDDGLKLGESAALHLLQDHLRELNTPNAEFSLTKFDGTNVSITPDEIRTTT